MEIKSEIVRSLNGLQKTVTIVAPLAALAVAFAWYRENIWRPNVSLVSVDYDKGIAAVKIGRKTRTLYAGSTISAGASWGVRFGSTDVYDTAASYDRVELVKNDLTYLTIDYRAATNGKATNKF